MCNNCTTIQSYTSTQKEGYDPTRTLTLRSAFVLDFKRRFAKLIRLVQESIVVNDCFGLTSNLSTNATYPAGRNQFLFPTSVQKSKQFMIWFNSQVNALLFEVGYLQQVGESLDSMWYNKYLMDSYKRGLLRAKAEMRKIGVSIPNEPISISLNVPLHIETLGVLYSRVFSELKGITAAMDTQISIVLTQGLADGESSSAIARKLINVINGAGATDKLGITDTLGRFIPGQRRAETLARTEIIRAHHRATINEYKNWGIFDVYVRAEVLTAGDNKVCPACDALQRNTYSLEAATVLIPVHPNCRCMCLPYQVTKSMFDNGTE